jgi:hypothetical protein
MRRAIFACAALIAAACGNVEDPVTGPTDRAVTATFTGWSGTCTGSGPCTVTVTLLGTAGGDGVSSSPAGIDCYDGGTGSCVASFHAGTVVTLTPTPGLIFWEAPGCTFSRTCTVTMSGDEIVLAHFD